MAREKSSLKRRELLQHMSVIGLGAVVSACGGSGNNGSGDASPTPRATRTPLPTQAPTDPPTSAPATATPMATATNSAVANTATPTSPSTATPSPTYTATPEDIACILTPEETIGPFFLDVGLARSDIREDLAGARLRLVLQLVDVDGCTPIRDVVANIWHADVNGRYSGFPNQLGGVDTTGQTFLRGFQITDANGRVEFTTIYPGWYPGRAVHIHVRFHLDASTILVSQLYFPEALTDAVYTLAPYNSRGNRDTSNSEDSIARNDLDELTLDAAAENDGYAASIVLGVAR